MMNWSWLGTLADPKQLFSKTWTNELLSKPEPRVALIGRSNVGKSSLINALARGTIARVSKTPGRTRAIQFFHDPESRVIIADLPGYGFARRSKEERDSWSNLIAQYLEGDDGLASLWVLLDARHGPTAVDREAIDYLAQFTGRHAGLVPVFTKWDELKNQSQRAKRKVEALRDLREIFGSELAVDEVHWCSSKSGYGLEGLGKRLQGIGDRNR